MAHLDILEQARVENLQLFHENVIVLKLSWVLLLAAFSDHRLVLKWCLDPAKQSSSFVEHEGWVVVMSSLGVLQSGFIFGGIILVFGQSNHFKCLAPLIVEIKPLGILGIKCGLSAC